MIPLIGLLVLACIGWATVCHYAGRLLCRAWLALRRRRMAVDRPARLVAPRVRPLLPYPCPCCRDASPGTMRAVLGWPDAFRCVLCGCIWEERRRVAS